MARQWNATSAPPANRGRLRLASMCAAIALLTAAAPGGAVGQSPWSYQVSAGTHALTVPWYVGPVGWRFDPAVLAGADRALNSGRHWTLSLGLRVGFFRDRWWMTGISLVPEIRIGRTLLGGLHADLGLGIGYLHFFWRRKTLVLEDGKYVESVNWGKPSLLVPLSLTLGYRGNPDRPLTVSPFVSARWGVQALFLSEAPVMTHFTLLGGVRIQSAR